MTLRRIPEKPRAKLFAFNRIIKRTIASSSASPTPAACERTNERCNFSKSSGAILVEASKPKPVLMP